MLIRSFDKKVFNIKPQLRNKRYIQQNSIEFSIYSACFTKKTKKKLPNKMNVCLS